MKGHIVWLSVLALVLLGSAASVPAQQASQQQIDELKRAVQQQEQSIRDLKARINELEGGKPLQVAPQEPVVRPGEAPAPAEEEEARVKAAYGIQSHVLYRANMDDKQEAAPRPGEYLLDPSYRGYIPIPYTVFMLKFNPKPRLDMMLDTDNPGNDVRFVPARIPVEGQSNHGGGERFNANGNGSQIRVDMRAPTLPGNYRLYYQNDFFGSDSSDFQFRLQHFYGQAYGIVGGFTYGIFEDPDAWPDTVDYEGPNAVIFARRALLHYTLTLPANFFLTLGLEDPKAFINTTGDPNAESKFRAPDGGFNVRWEPGDLGHIQFSSIFRSLGIQGDIVDDQDVFGWGLNLAGSINITPNNTFQFYGVYGQGVGGLGNDAGFDDSDAALDGDGDLVALEYVSGMLAFTHVWTPRWRSTATYGYVNVENTGMQADDAYDYTHYASANLIYKIFKRLSVGGEVLYGFRNVKSGDDGDVVRFQMSFVYAPFD